MIGPCDLGESGAKHDANSDMRRIATRLDNARDITAQRRDAGLHDAAAWWEHARAAQLVTMPRTASTAGSNPARII